jgi:hypothetical protein
MVCPLKLFGCLLVGLLLLKVSPQRAQAQSGAPSGEPAPILSKQKVLDRQSWWDNKDWSWYKENIPFFDSPDTHINATYYYRWEVLTKHLLYASPETGYMFTEFIDRPPWSGAYGAISCPLGHQFYEIRWLKNRRIIWDFATYWFDTPGAEPRSYSNWYGDSMWAIYEVLHDRGFIETTYPYMQQQYQGWIDEHFDPEHNMFQWDGMHDGMETNINSRQTENTFSGGDGYRPTLNSYLYGDLRALSQTADLLGEPEKARTYAQKAQAIKQRVQEELWDPDRQFFFHQWAEDKQNGIEAKTLTHETGKYAGSPHGRELHGYVPWQFNLPDDQPDDGYAEAWKFLMDDDYFWARYGPTTTERGDPLFRVSPRCCQWSGNSWPFATTQTLAAMANLLNNYDQDVVDREDYFDLLKVYTRTQRQNGRPYVAEAANPYTGSWSGHDRFYHSEHYSHSGYVDLIISGLVGLRPQADDTIEVNPQIPEKWDYFALDDVAYHGHRVSIVWDRNGEKYGRGKGLMLFVNGEKVASTPEVGRLTAEIPAAPDRPSPDHQPVNFAVNNGRGFYPHLSASYSRPARPLFFANDGNYWYHPSPPNRWTTEGSGSQDEWMTVNFGADRPISTVKLYFLDDESGVKAPLRYTVQAWDGQSWNDVPDAQRDPEQPLGHRPNTVTFDEVTTSKLRVQMQSVPGAAVGLTEIEAWGPSPLPLSEPSSADVPNLAYNGDGEGFPKITASYRKNRMGKLVDGKSVLWARTRNTWTSRKSPNETDWIEVTFDAPKTVRAIDLLFWGLKGSEGVGAPEGYTVEYWDEEQWTEATPVRKRPQTPTVRAENTVEIEPVKTKKVRVALEHASSSATGLTEMRIWEGEGSR